MNSLNKVLLRPLKTDDLDWLLSIENNQKYWTVSGTTHAFTKEQLKSYIGNAQESIYIAKQYRFVIEYRKDAVGLIDLFDFDIQNKKAGVGVLIEEPFQSKGIGSEALQLLIKHAFKQLKLQQLYASISIDNQNSIKLFKKNNFSLVNTKKDSIFTDETKQDILFFQLLNK